jgi:hypothetical protein
MKGISGNNVAPSGLGVIAGNLSAAADYYTPPLCGWCVELCSENGLNSKEYSDTH